LSGHAELFPLKILIAGGLGAGKTTFVRALSEIPPVVTEQQMTTVSIPVDKTAAVPDKRTTTVALDFGRITVEDHLVLYLFGTPGQQRFWFMWDELARGCVGAVVLVDLRRHDDSFAAIDYFAHRDVPFVVAINRFPDADTYHEAEVRDALALGVDTPITWIDARDPDSGLTALRALVEHAIARTTPTAPAVEVPQPRPSTEDGELLDEVGDGHEVEAGERRRP
jgi:uncharacterized protein